MEYAILAFLAVFLLFASGLLLLFYREVLGQRLASILSPRGDAAAGASVRRRFGEATEALGAFAGRIGRALPQGETEKTALQQRLIKAGYRADIHANMFSASKAIVPLLLCGIAAGTGVYLWNPFIVFLIAAGFGYLLPDYWLDHMIKARETTLELDLPDLFDLMVVCLEAGLSLDQATLRASAEMRFAHPTIADELGLVMLEVRAGQPRMEAWKHLTSRSNLESIRMFVMILMQADQFGTGMSKTLRTHSEVMRTRKRQRVEELAAKTSVKLVFPLVFCIFPSLLIVVLAPAAILLMEAFPG